MKLSTGIIIGVAALAIAVVYTKSKSNPTLIASSPSSPAISGLFSGIGAGLTRLISPGASSSSSTNTTFSNATSAAVANSPIQDTGSGFAVSNGEIGNIAGYDAQTGAVGVYGIDYGE